MSVNSRRNLATPRPGERFFNSTMRWDEISDRCIRFTVTHCRFPELCAAAGLEIRRWRAARPVDPPLDAALLQAPEQRPARKAAADAVILPITANDEKRDRHRGVPGS